MRKVRITDLAEINPPLTVRVQNDAEVAFIPMSAVKEGGGIKLLEQAKYSEVSTGFTKFQDRDVLFAKITPCMENGKGALVENLPNKVGCGSTEFHVLRARENCASGYLFQVMQWSVVRQKAETFMSGSAGQQRVLSDFFTRHKVYAPPLEAQRKVAQILQTIDQAIEHTSTLVEKYQQIKVGLMHDLFTRGIGADGKLRPSREQAPDLYQQTPIGWIPKEWCLAPLHTIADVVDPQPDHRTPPENSDGTPYVGIGDFDEFGELDFSRCRKVVSSAFQKQRIRFRAASGDLIFGKIGTIGRPRVLPDGEFALSANVVLIQPRIQSNYVKHSLDSTSFLKQISDVTNTTSQPALGIEKIREIKVSTPIKSSEMINLAGQLDAIDMKLKNERWALKKWGAQKAGLMHDLLTGKVQVTPDPEAIHV